MQTTLETPPPQTEAPKQNVIVQLVTKNYKKIKAITVIPNGSTVTLKGKNGAGKSSLLDSILAVLSGKMCERPIREGASKSENEIDFGDFKARLTITHKSGPTIRVESKTGAEISGPRTFLKAHSNEILLDPVGFMRLGETPEGRRKQAEMLRKLVGLDFTSLDTESAAKYAERTNVNRELETAKTKLASYSKHEGAPAEEVSAVSLMGELQKVQAAGDERLRLAREKNAANQKVKDHWKEIAQLAGDHQASIDDANEEIAELEKRIKALQEEVTACQKRAVALTIDHDKAVRAVAEAEKEVAALVYDSEETISAEIVESRKPIQQRILDADETNRKVRENKRHAELSLEVACKQGLSEKLTARITEIEQSKQDHLAKAPFPLPGLSFDETGILLNKLPLNQGSQAQQIKAVMAIGFAFKPRIPVALIRDASILDEESHKEMAAMADKNGGQCWLEVLESDDDKALTIIDGMVAE